MYLHQLSLSVLVVTHVLLMDLGNWIPKQWCHIWGQLITTIRLSMAVAGNVKNRTKPFLVSLPSHVEILLIIMILVMWTFFFFFSRAKMKLLPKPPGEFCLNLAALKKYVYKFK